MTIEIVETTGLDGTVTEHVVIDRGNNEFTSMTKAHYEAQQAEQSTPSVTSGK